MNVPAFKQFWAPRVCAFLLHRRLKTYLFVEAEKLTVAYPTVQHAVDMDVVGLQQKVTLNNATLLMAVYRADSRTQISDFCLFLFALLLKAEPAACIPTQLSITQ